MIEVEQKGSGLESSFISELLKKCFQILGFIVTFYHLNIKVMTKKNIEQHPFGTFLLCHPFSWSVSWTCMTDIPLSFIFHFPFTLPANLLSLFFPPKSILHILSWIDLAISYHWCISADVSPPHLDWYYSFPSAIFISLCLIPLVLTYAVFHCCP